MFYVIILFMHIVTGMFQFIFIALAIILLSPLIILAIFYFGILHLLETPKRRRNLQKYKFLVKSLMADERKAAYLWYDRNGPLCNYIETTFVPKYSDSLLYEYGDDDGLKLPGKYNELTTLLLQFAENGYNSITDGEIDYDCCNDNPRMARLYVLNKSKDGLIEYTSLRDNDASSTNIDKTIKMFEQEMQDALQL